MTATAWRARAVRWAPHAITIALLIACAIPRAQLAFAWMEPSIDGGLYLDVADHVARGDGLVTDLSLYHHGADAFPAPTSLYPIWPLLLGAAAKATSLDAARRVLPLVLTLVGLWLGAALARRLHPRPILGVLDAGHFFIVVLGLAKPSLRFLALPYTEPLGLVITAAALWRALHLMGATDPRRSARAGLELGVWCGLAFLVRSQLAVLPAALGGVMLWDAWARRDRARMIAFFALCGGFAVTVGPWFAWTTTFVAEPGFSSLTSFETARHSTLLSKFDAYVKHKGAAGRVSAIWQGFGVAFGKSKLSLWASYTWWMYAIPAALVALAVPLTRDLVKRRTHNGDECDAGDDAGLTFARRAFVVFAVANVALLHLMQKSYLSEWPFARRHGVVYAFAIVLALVFLASRRFLLWPALALVITLAGAKDAADDAHDELQKAQISKRRKKSAFKERERVADRLEALRKEDGVDWLVIASATNEGQRLAWRTDRIGYHWIHDTTTTHDLMKLIHERGVRYVVTRARAVKKNGPRDGVPPSLSRHFELMERVGKRYAIWKRIDVDAPAQRATTDQLAD